MQDKANENKWSKPDHLSVDAILNYWFGQDKEVRLEQRELLKMACLQGQLDCVQNCEEEKDASLADLFEAGKILIKGESFEKWLSGEKMEITDPGTPKHWFDVVLEEGDELREKAAEKEKAEEERLKNERRIQEQKEIKERARLEAEAKLEAELEFKNKSKKRVEGVGPVDRRRYNSYVHLVGAMYDTFIINEHGSKLPKSQEELISHIEFHYAGVDGLSRRTLADGRFKDAIRELNAKKDG